MAVFENERSRKIFAAVADAAERAGGSLIADLGDGRFITVVVVHDDAQPVPEGGA
jgi:hypothetical protein